MFIGSAASAGFRLIKYGITISNYRAAVLPKFLSALRSRLILVRLLLRGAVFENNGSGSGSGSELKLKKNQHIFDKSIFYFLKVQFLIKMDLKKLKGAFTHDTTELPNYN